MPWGLHVIQARSAYRGLNHSDPFGSCDESKPLCQAWMNLKSGFSIASSGQGGSCDDAGRSTGALLGLAANVIPTARFGGMGARGAAALGDDALVVRGGTNTAERLAAGAEWIDDAGRVHGVSVNSASGASLRQVAAGIPHNQIGVTTAGAIRAAGGRVAADATRSNPLHGKVSHITPEALSRLLTPTVRNPAR